MNTNDHESHILLAKKNLSYVHTYRYENDSLNFDDSQYGI